MRLISSTLALAVISGACQVPSGSPAPDVSHSTDDSAKWSDVSDSGYVDGDVLLYHRDGVDYRGVVTATDHFYRVPASKLTADELALADDAFAKYRLRLRWDGNGRFASLTPVR